MKMFIFCYTLFVLFNVYDEINGQLVVNVKNKGDEVMQEVFEANTTTDTIRLIFRQMDGTFISQFIDFKNEMQIFKAVILGEEERDEAPYQSLCFVLPFTHNEFITSDAMSKLRQKNSEAIRHAEEERAEETYDLDVRLETRALRTGHLHTQCANSLVFINHTHLASLNTRVNAEMSHRLSIENLEECDQTVPTDQPCACSYRICVRWYPCGLKYCKGKDSAGKTVSYRCGIKTCNKCRRFRFYAPQRRACSWYDDFISR